LAIDPNDKTDPWLLAGMYHHSDMLRNVLERYAARYTLFDPIADPGMSAMLRLIMEHFKGLHGIPPVTILKQYILQWLQTRPSLPLGHLTRVFNFVQYLDYPLSEFPKEQIQKILDATLKNAVRVEMTKKAGQPGVDIASELGKMLTDVQSTRAIKSARKYPCKAVRASLRPESRNRWGLSFLDSNDSGWGPGEMVGILGPSGGGKTIMTTMLAKAFVRKGMKVCIALYEQPLEGDVQQRILSQLAGIPISKLRTSDENLVGVEIAEEILQRMDVVEEMVGDSIVVLDMATEHSGVGGPSELIAHLKDLEKDGEMPDILIIDWLGAAVQRWDPSTMSQVVARGDFHSRAMAWLLDLRGFLNAVPVDKKKPVLVVEHQTSTNAQERPPAYKPLTTDSMEFRTFQNYMDMCYQMGTRCKESLCSWFIHGKVRRGRPMECIIQLNPEYLEVEDVSDSYSMLDGRFVDSEFKKKFCEEHKDRAEKASADMWKA